MNNTLRGATPSMTACPTLDIETIPNDHCRNRGKIITHLVGMEEEEGWSYPYSLETTPMDGQQGQRDILE